MDFVALLPLAPRCVSPLLRNPLTPPHKGALAPCHWHDGPAFEPARGEGT